MSDRLGRIFSLSLLLALAAPGSALAIPPLGVPVQGGLLTSGGTPTSDGNYAMTFAIYASNAATTALWKEIHVAVPVQAGLFSRVLGFEDETKPLSVALFAANPELWLGLKVGGDPELPRVRLWSAPYAMVAGHAVEAEGVTTPLGADKVDFNYAASSGKGGAATDLACTLCVGEGEIAAGSVTADKLGFTYAGSSTKGGAATSALGLECTGCIDASHIALGSISPDRLAMGAGSGLDADKLDGHSSEEFFLKSEAIPAMYALTGEQNVDDGVPILAAVRAPASGAFKKAHLDAFGLKYIVPLSQSLAYVKTTDTDFGDGVGDGVIIAGTGTDAGVTLPTVNGDGGDGPMTVNGGTASINTTTLPVNAIGGNKQLIVSNTSGLKKGQILLLHQTQGSGAGTWEEVIVSDIADAQNVNVVSPPKATYKTGGADVAQAVVVPRYTDLTVSAGATLTAPAWDGKTGGILAFKASGTVKIEGAITMAGRGFRGGTAAPSGSDYVVNNQGEGTPGGGSKSAAANGNGGGSGCGQEGGAGGGYAAQGTNGTKSGCACGSTATGGWAVGDQNLKTAFLGGGGGASGSHGGGGRDGANGGPGGGLVLIGAGTLTVSGVINANGATGSGGYCANAAAQPMGGGGGGAGGGIYLVASKVTVQGSGVTAVGGPGGGNNNCGGCNPSGAGGAGSAGRIFLAGTQVTAVTTPTPTIDQSGGTQLLGTYRSAVTDTLIVAAKLTKVEWTAGVPSGSALTFSVRASDTPFAPTDASPSWTTIASSGSNTTLKGRFMQFRVQLTGSQSTAPIVADTKLTVLGSTQLSTLPAGVTIKLGTADVAPTQPSPTGPLEAIASQIDVTTALNAALKAGSGLATMQIGSTQAGRLQWVLYLEP